jgi:hypothetical protein
VSTFFLLYSAIKMRGRKNSNNLKNMCAIKYLMSKNTNLKSSIFIK